MVCTDSKEADTSRFGVLKMNEDCRIEEFEEKPMVSSSNVISTGIYVIRRRQLIEMIERSAQEDRYDFVKDILIRYKNLKRIYGYKINTYWSNIATVDSYYRTNMDFPETGGKRLLLRTVSGHLLQDRRSSAGKIQSWLHSEKFSCIQRLYHQRTG